MITYAINSGMCHKGCANGTQQFFHNNPDYWRVKIENWHLDSSRSSKIDTRTFLILTFQVLPPFLLWGERRRPDYCGIGLNSISKSWYNRVLTRYQYEKRKLVVAMIVWTGLYFIQDTVLLRKSNITESKLRIQNTGSTNSLLHTTRPKSLKAYSPPHYSPHKYG